MRRIGILELYLHDTYIDVGFDYSNNIFGLQQDRFTEGYVLRIWGSLNANWLDRYGVECTSLGNEYYGIIVEGDVDEV